METHVIKSFNIQHTATVAAFVYGAMGCISGVAMFLGGLVHGHVGFALFALIMYPLMMYGMVLLATVLAAWLYNVIAARIGGIAVELAEIKPKPGA